MPKKILDLHIHSKYSRACSRDLELPKIASACVIKGIDICATGDFTHPLWLEHIKESLEEIGGSGLYTLKNNGTKGKEPENDVKFILSTEISCIYKHKDATRRLHLVILAPNIEAVEKFNRALENRGANLRSDGRPILGMPAKEILRLLLDVDERFMLIPAHAWTPWFSIFGSKSGYNSVEECFEELAPHISALETGLSSDPAMNHLWSALDKYTLVSNSDAHSLNKLGREANVINFTGEGDITFAEIMRIIRKKDREKFFYTIEFFPEEGKYHFDGHAACDISLEPEKTKKENFICPVCKKKLTVGVLHRVMELADRSAGEIKPEQFIPHKYAVPLAELISSVFGVGENSKKVRTEYDRLIKNVGSEFYLLLEAPVEEIKKYASDENIATAVANMRQGKIKVIPGYDGVFGKVEFLSSQAKKAPLQGRLQIQ